MTGKTPVNDYSESEFSNLRIKNSTTKDVFDMIGWILTLVVPVLFYLYSPAIVVDGFDYEPKVFICIILSTSVMWIFSLLPEFMPSIFAILSTLLLSLVDSSIILSGFSSATFVIVLSIIIMTIAIIQSGIMKRFLLSLLKNTKTVHSASWALFGFGFLISPFLPSVINRTQLLSPLVKEVGESLDVTKEGNSLLYTSGYVGTTLLASSFLSASLLNFIIFSLLPLQEQQQFQSIGWFQGTLVISGILLLSYLLILPIFFHGKHIKEKVPHNFHHSLEKMGKVKPAELISLAALLVFFLGILTTQHHHISGSWLGFSLLFLLLVLGYIKLEDFQRKVDWPYLFLLSSIVGISNTFKTLGLDTWLYNHLLTVFPEILKDKFLLFSFVTTITLGLRLILPVGAVVALLAPIILTIAVKIGVSGWALCMVLLFVGDIWFFPYQCTFYQIYKSGFNSSNLNEKKFLILNAVINLLKLLALYLSFYYWKYLSLI